jgi:hypothetical protein
MKKTRISATIFLITFLGVTLSTFASESAGSSAVDGAFLTLSLDVVHGHTAYRSFETTPRTRKTFSEICAKGKDVWVNNRKTSCVRSEVLDEGKGIEVDVAAAPPTSPESYFLVSAYPSTSMELRALSNDERLALTRSLENGDAGSPKTKITSSTLIRARAVSGGGRVYLFVATGQDREGNRLTHVFALTAGKARFLGELPDWPDKVVDLGRKGLVWAILNKSGDARVIQVLSLWPSIAPEMYAGEGG